MLFELPTLGKVSEKKKTIFFQTVKMSFTEKKLSHEWNIKISNVDPPQFFFSESFPVTMVESVGGVPVVLDRLQSAQYQYNSS